MIEGISSQDPAGSPPNPQNPWETPPTVFPAQESPSPLPPPPFPSGPSPDPVTPVVVAQEPAKKGNGGSFSSGNSDLTKKIIKIGIGLFVVLTLIFVIFALIVPRFSKPSNKEVTLTYWGLWEDENVLRPVLAEFEKENPNIKIDYKKQDPVDYRERLTVRSENGNGPDIFRFHNTWYPMLSGLLLPLPKETIERKEFEENYYTVAQTDLIKRGTIYGIPLETDTLSLYVNTQLFDAAAGEEGGAPPIPKTWQEFIDTSARLTKRNESGDIVQAGAAIGTYDNVMHSADIISLLFAQNGVDLQNVSDSEEKVRDALRFYTNFAAVENNVWDQTQDSSLLVFSQGNLAMYFGYSWDYFSIKAQNPNLVFKVAPVPQLVSDDTANIASYWAEGASNKSKHPKEALLFMKFLAKKETQEKLFAEESKTRLFGEPYSNKNLADKLKDSEAFVFVDQSKTALSSPFIDGTNDNGLNDKLNNYLKDSVNAILSGESEETSTQTFLQGYSQVIGQYNGTASN